MSRPLVHSSTMSDVYYRSGSNEIEKHRGSRNGSEVILDREAQVLQALGGKVGPKFVSYDSTQKVLVMSRLGTHDLSDVIHDLPKNFIPGLVKQFMNDVQTIHDLGYIHRDIKPGNVMVNLDHRGVYSYAGLVDFGMTLISNRKQNEDLALGGTAPYTHPTQMEKEYKQMRCHPGQDWYAAARTISHILVGGSSSAFEASLQKDAAAEIINSTIVNAESIFGADKTTLISFLSEALKPESSRQESLSRLFQLGTEALNELNQSQMPNFTTVNPGPIAFQEKSSARPKRHDVVLIVDATGSMKSKIDRLRNTFEEIAELVKGRIDLRVDLWSLGDYSKDDKVQSSVQFLGQRMRSETFQRSLEYLEANRGQEDEAEAYEMALQYAYLLHPKSYWSPRKETQRTIIVVGDSYAHGWLDKFDPWGRVINGAKGKWNPKLGVRGPPTPEVKKMYDDFERRHKIYMTKERQSKEKEAYQKAFAQLESKDRIRKNEEGHAPIRGEVVSNRANWRKAITKCTEEKNATIHTVGVSRNYVSSSFLKYVAMYGNGTYTELGADDGDLIIILKGIFTSVDAKIFKDLEKDTMLTNPNTQALSSITTFVIDSLSNMN